MSPIYTHYRQHHQLLIDRQAALTRTGERKHTRYQLRIPLRSVTSVVVNERGEVVSKGAEGR
ncbi:MAG: hypothetical protein ACLP56_10025 [Candidatus Sulfotelmatobacter sp.]